MARLLPQASDTGYRRPQVVSLMADFGGLGMAWWAFMDLPYRTHFLSDSEARPWIWELACSNRFPDTLLTDARKHVSSD